MIGRLLRSRVCCDRRHLQTVRLLRSRGLLWLPASTDGAAPPEPVFVMIACVHIRCGAYGAGFVVMAGVY